MRLRKGSGSDTACVYRGAHYTGNDRTCYGACYSSDYAASYRTCNAAAYRARYRTLYRASHGAY